MYKLPPLDSLGLTGFTVSSANMYIGSGRDISKGKISNNPLDYTVHLPSFGFDLQRPLCWTQPQKREWIWSILKRRPLPPVAVSENILPDDSSVIYVIDGKQRLSTLAEFLNHGFCLEADTKTRLSQLPEDYQKRLLFLPIQGYVAYDLTEKQMLQWFRWINFAGTEQDAEHLAKLDKAYDRLSRAAK